MRPLLDALEDMRDAHREACDWGLWGGDGVAILSGPAGQRTRNAMTRFETLYTKLSRQLAELEAAK
jgi:hypothetical protein